MKQKVTLDNKLVVGQTGSGRFNYINKYINDLVHNFTAEDLRIILIDPKSVQFTSYNSLPHLMFSIVSGNDDFKKVIDWACIETDIRLIPKENINNDVRIPIVIIIDEIADFVIADKDYVENAIEKITKNSEFTGIYVLLSTARVVDSVLSERIINSFNNRMAFRLGSEQESILVLHEIGAETLSLPGTCLIKNMKSGLTEKVKMPFISDEEIGYNNC